MTNVTFAPTASLLLYLTPERVVPNRGHIPGNNAQIPGRDLKVNKLELTSALLAVALWELHFLGSVDLAIVEGKVLFKKTSHVQVTLKQPLERGGIEGEVLALLRQKPSTSVKDLLRQWFREDMPDPWGHVLTAVQREGVVCGYLTPVKRGVVDVLKSKLAVEANAQALVMVQPACEAVINGWLQFTASQPTLTSQLLRDCSAAIRSRHEQQDTSDF